MVVAKFQYILNNYNAIKLEKNKVFIFFNFLKNLKTLLGADEGTRTPTPLALVPKTSASTNSATSAFFIDIIYNSTFKLLLSIVFLNFFNFQM